MSDLPLRIRQNPIYLSNWASRKTPGHHGPGRKWTIMAKPRHWEQGAGQVAALTPLTNDLVSVRGGLISAGEYKARYLQLVEAWCNTSSRFSPHHPLAQGILRARRRRSGAQFGFGLAVVAGGDTLCCACSRAAAAQGECHRVWAAELLRDAGWRVILDGEELT